MYEAMEWSRWPQRLGAWCHRAEMSSVRVEGSNVAKCFVWSVRRAPLQCYLRRYTSTKQALPQAIGRIRSWSQPLRLPRSPISLTIFLPQQSQVEQNHGKSTLEARISFTLSPRLRNSASTRACATSIVGRSPSEGVDAFMSEAHASTWNRSNQPGSKSHRANTAAARSPDPRS